jgi:hypothetical protein
MIEFSKPKIGDIRFLAFQNHSKENFWLQKVEITKVGKTWVQANILQHIVGTPMNLDVKQTGQYYPFCFLKTEEDAKKLLILDTFDTRSVHIFFRDEPDIEELL